MRIGIDIDDTLTDVKDKLTNAAKEYAISLNKTVSSDTYKINDIYNNGNIYQRLFDFNYEELKHFLGEIQESITDNAIPRENAVESINKLKEDGHEIYIITARDSEFHKDPYNQSKTWLDNNRFKYDKLIVNARDKAKVCLENNIDILIDDSQSNCTYVSNVGIKTIMISKEVNDKFTVFNNWSDIYDYISKNGNLK